MKKLHFSTFAWLLQWIKYNCQSILTYRCKNDFSIFFTDTEIGSDILRGLQDDPIWRSTNAKIIQNVSLKFLPQNLSF